jgi:hypothetical protein
MNETLRHTKNMLFMVGKLSVGLIVAVAILSPAHAQDSLLIIGPGTRTLGSNRENMETPYYRVGSFGWLGVKMKEQHGEWYYPTPNDRHDPGYFGLDAHNAVRADFNGDGREDLCITWAIFPHTIERQSRASFSILLNDGYGALTYAPGMFDHNGPPVRFFAYRTAVADFNGDGKPDIVAASMGMIKRNPDGTYTNRWEPIPLVLSTPEGKLRDASANIQGQESGGLPEGFTFGHELSAGDVNGDGAPDFFTGKCLFLNDGNGKFTNASAHLPQEMRPTGTYLMHSMIADLNGDGIGDIVAAYADGAAENHSGYILLSKNGSASLANRQLVALPPGRYGAGVTKFNHGVIYDVNNDALPDIVFSVTRANPYYMGRTLQVLMNRGNGVFVDETDQRVITPTFLDRAQGEGSLQVVDVNGDGVLDLVHSGSTPFTETEPHALTIYLNSNGALRAQGASLFAWVQPWQINGFGEDFRPYQTRAMGRAYPIDLDGKAGVDFVSVVATPLRAWPQVEPNEYTFYSILSASQLTSSGNEAAKLPTTFWLSQNYPNPFNPTTTIQFSVEHSARALLRVYDILGRGVRTLYDGEARAGLMHQVVFDAAGLASGIYFVRLESSGSVTTRRVLLAR